MSATEQVAGSTTTPAAENGDQSMVTPQVVSHVKAGDKHELDANDSDTGITKSQPAKKKAKAADRVDDENSTASKQEKVDADQPNGKIGAKDEVTKPKASTNGTHSETAKSEAKANGDTDVTMHANVSSKDKEKSDSQGKASADSTTAAHTNGDDKNGTATKVATTNGDDDHLNHPERWATGDDPATRKQKNFIAVLEKKAEEADVGEVKGVEHPENLSKAEACERIGELKEVTA